MFFPRFKKSTNNKGFSIIEALVGITLAALLLVAFTALISQTIKINHANTSGLKATMYLQELIEIAKDLEQSTSTWQSNWISTTGQECNTLYVCYPMASGTTWTLISTTTTAKGEYLENNIYTRWLTIENVCRDSNKNIDACPSDELSTSTKKVIATITWNNGFGSQTSTLETYVYTY